MPFVKPILPPLTQELLKLILPPARQGLAIPIPNERNFIDICLVSGNINIR